MTISTHSSLRVDFFQALVACMYKSARPCGPVEFMSHQRDGDTQPVMKVDKCQMWQIPMGSEMLIVRPERMFSINLQLQHSS